MCHGCGLEENNSPNPQRYFILVIGFSYFEYSFGHFFFLGVATVILHFVSIQWLVFQNVLAKGRKIRLLERPGGREREAGRGEKGELGS